MWKKDPKINIYTKNKHDHVQTQMKNLFVTVELLYGTPERGKGKENDRASVISHNIKYEGRGYKNMYRKLLKSQGGG
jgi:hypothetical protein